MTARKPQDASGGSLAYPRASEGALRPQDAILLETYFRNKDEKTVRTYRRCLQDLADWMGEGSLEGAAARFLSGGQGNANLTALNFKDHLKKQGYAPSSVNTHLVALRSLVKIGRLLGQIPWSLDVENVKNEIYRDTAGPGTERFNQVMQDLASKTDPMEIRDRLVLKMIHDAGLRRDEVSSIDLEHVDFENGRLWVRAKKRTARVSVPMNPAVAADVKIWLGVRGGAPGPLFSNFSQAGTGAGLTGHSVGRICKKYGLGHAHGLRHLAITEALKVTNGNISEVMKFSRHSDPKTVMIYDDNRKNVPMDISQKLSELRNANHGGNTE